MTMQIEVRTVYGRETIYPADQTAKLFAKIAGTTTLTRRVVGIAVALGYEVEVVPTKAQVAVMIGAF